MDFEKQSQISSQRPIYAAYQQSTTFKVVRAAQYVWSTIALVFIACAIDRNILVPGVTADEKALAVSSVVAVIVVLYHLVAPYRKLVAVVIDVTVTALLFATFVYGAYNASEGRGACTGPAKFGKWDNTRGCVRMTVSAGFTAVNFANFATSAVLAMCS